MESIAIIGLGCRFPRAKDPEQFWQVLRDGVDTITEVPSERWNVDAFYNQEPATPGKMSTRWGGFLEQVDQFDASFFGISPREVERMDPQQRLVLEVAWEALENAGIAPERVAGSQTGVFIGIGNYDYPRSVSKDLYRINAYDGTGSAFSIVANRLSYVLDLRGPSLAIDTACSSALVAVHYACKSLESKESDLCLVGGVNLVLSPEGTISYSHARMMAADGRCKVFDTSADGFVRGEGCGIVVLKRLADALRDGDRILTLIKGSAVNQDGLSNGLTAPNGPAQRAVICQALKNAGVAPRQISYVEAHGTGTSLGDPIEFKSLKAVLMEGREPNQHCWIGSVKTNIGHLEAAAGIAGLIKVVLSLQHQEIPPHLHLKQLNPYISLEGTPFSIPTERQPWIASTEPRLAGISAFSFGGTNCHLILEEAPASAVSNQLSAVSNNGKPITQVERPQHLLTLSAKSENALEELAKRYETFLASYPEASLADICFTTNTGRSHFDHRLAVVAESTEQLHQQLSAFAAGKEAIGLVRNPTTSRKRRKLAFLFTGQGSQYFGMGRQLYESQPTFRAAIDRCAEILHPYLEKPLLDVLYPASEVSSPIDETAYTQPALFALEYALAQLWQSWGIQPSLVMGHSVGEYVAACIAGVFSLEDGLKLIATRARLMQALPRSGAMVAVLADEDKVRAAIEPYEQEVSLAAINGPESIVISGKSQAVEVICTNLEAIGIKTKPLKVSHAFHSPLMEPMLAEFERVAKEITYSTPKTSIISNVTGQLATAEIATAEYWCRHIIQPVRFAASIDTLQQQGYEILLEIGSKPTLLGMARYCLQATVNSALLPSLRPGYSDWQQMLESLGQLYVRGVAIDWSSFDRDYSRHRVVLPTYPFQRQRYWAEVDEFSFQTTAYSSTNGSRSKNLHPLIERRIYSALKQREIQFETHISQDSPAFLKHHRVYQAAVVPTSAYIEMVLAAGAAAFKSDNLVLEDVAIQQALILPEDTVKTLQLIFIPEDSNIFQFQIFSLNSAEEDEEPSWTFHISGKVLVADENENYPPDELAALQAQCNQEIPIKTYYQQLQNQGIDFGSSFRAIQQLWQCEGKALGQIQLSETLVTEAENYKLHPVLLDACLQVFGAVLPEKAKDDTYMQVGLERLRIYRRPSTSLWTYAKIRPVQNSNHTILTGDLRLLTLDGQVVAEVEGLQLKRASREALLGSTQKSLQNWLYEVEWRPRVRFGNLPPDYLLTPSEISDRLRSQYAELMSQPSLKSYGKLLNQLEVLSIAYVLKAFDEMGWEFQLGQHFSLESIAKQGGIVSQHRRLLGRLLEMLVDVGVLQQKGSQWEVIRVPEKPNPQAQVTQLFAQYPTAVAELTLLERCASKLTPVLRGECDPIQLLFPDGDLTTATQLYQDSPGAQVINTLVQQAIVTALEHVPKNRGVRVLEIGAGTGGTTAYILPRLNANQTEYVFTDVGTLFTAKAQEKFRDYSFIRYQVLDIEQDPSSQGFDEHQYDLIVAANVLHATQDLRQALQHVQQLLAPGGMLVLLEGTVRQRWMDLIFGLTEGWWRFTDHSLRPNYPLLSADQWQVLFQEMGFQEAITIGRDRQNQGSLSMQASVIVAKAASTPLTVATFEPRSWLILADAKGIGHQLAAHLRSKGESCTLVFLGTEYKKLAEQEFRINPANPSEFRRLLADVGAQQCPLHGVLHLWSLDAAAADTLTSYTLETAFQQGCGSTLHLVQALLEVGFSLPPSLWLVTQAAQPVGVEPQVLGVAQSPLWGMGKVIAIEHPELWGGMVDLPPDADGDAVAALFAEIWDRESEDHIAFREGQRYVLRMIRSSLPEPQELPVRSDSTYLITGGLGVLGLRVAHWLVKQGVQHLVLVGRSAPSSAVQETLKSWEQDGIQILTARADVSKEADVVRVLEMVKATLPPLKGIIHSAGVSGYQALKEMKFDAFAAMLRPKVLGMWNLHQLTQEMQLDFFVGFSSMVSVWGAKGQAHYVAANHFLDMFAHYRRGQQLPALSINWGPLTGGGLLSSEILDSLVQIGVEPLQPEHIVNALGYLLGSECTQTTVANIDWSIYKRLYEATGEKPLLSEISVQPQPTAAQQSLQQSKILEELQIAPVSDRTQLLITYLQTEVAKVLGLGPSQLPDPQQGFFDMGMDSLMSVDLKSRLEADLRASLPSTLAFDFPTMQHLAEYLTQKVLRWESPETCLAELPTEEDEQTEAVLEIEQLSEDEVEASIADKLAKLESLLRGN